MIQNRVKGQRALVTGAYRVSAEVETASAGSGRWSRARRRAPAARSRPSRPAAGLMSASIRPANHDEYGT
jgi:hypothetical protein